MSFSNPRNIISQLGLREGTRVADFGAGPGHYSMLLSERVGENGKVFAIDLQKELLKKVKNLSRTEHTTNVEVIWGDLEERGDSKLDAESVDAVVMSNMLFQVDHRRAVVEEAARILKSGGKALVVDWTDSFGGLGPRPEDVLAPAAAKALFEDAGFVLEKEVQNPGDHHYGYIFTKK